MIHLFKLNLETRSYCKSSKGREDILVFSRGESYKRSCFFYGEYCCILNKDVNPSGSNIQNRRNHDEPEEKEIRNEDQDQMLHSSSSASNLKTFSFEELKAATRNFRPDNILGENGSGYYVFKGWIDEILFTATKPGTGIPIVVIKSSACGFPWSQRMVGNSSLQPFSWNLRMKVALGVAKGLAFLHSAETQILYGKFKISYILLDSNYDAKLSDFGLVEDANSDVDGRRPDSPRYITRHPDIAPEYDFTGEFTAKSDVYCFGVVLLQMLCGRRAMDTSRPSGEQNLVQWAKPYLNNKRKISGVIDTRVEGQYKPREAQKTAMLTLNACRWSLNTGQAWMRLWWHWSSFRIQIEYYTMVQFLHWIKVTHGYQSIGLT